MLPSGGQRKIQTPTKTKQIPHGRILKYLTEDSNQQQSLHTTISSKKKKQQHNSKTKTTTKFQKDARSKHEQLTLASSHIYIQKEKAAPTFHFNRTNSTVDKEISLSLRLWDRIPCQKNAKIHCFCALLWQNHCFATYTYGNSAHCQKRVPSII